LIEKRAIRRFIRVRQAPRPTGRQIVTVIAPYGVCRETATAGARARKIRRTVRPTSRRRREVRGPGKNLVRRRQIEEPAGNSRTPRIRASLWPEPLVRNARNPGADPRRAGAGPVPGRKAGPGQVKTHAQPAGASAADANSFTRQSRTMRTQRGAGGGERGIEPHILQGRRGPWRPARDGDRGECTVDGPARWSRPEQRLPPRAQGPRHVYAEAHTGSRR